jgi:subfamily B ATP-binding cassette protein MsbA
MFKEFAQLRIVRIVRPHWKVLSLALLAVVGETVADIVSPWPITIVVDNVLQGKRLHGTLEAIVTSIFGQNSSSLLAFALALVLLVAIVGGISTYVEKYLTTSVSQWVAHDMRMLLYQRIQRLSLAEHGKARVGDLVTRVTKDIDAIQDFIDQALIGMVVAVMTLVGMIGVMLWVNWRFTLVGLSIAPVLFIFVFLYSKKIKAASRAVKKRERADVRRGGGADVDPGHAGLRARGFRGPEVRFREPRERPHGTAGAQRQRRSCRRWWT